MKAVKTITEQLSRELHLPAESPLQSPCPPQGGGGPLPARLQAGPPRQDRGEQPEGGGAPQTAAI